MAQGRAEPNHSTSHKTDNLKAQPWLRTRRSYLSIVRLASDGTVPFRELLNRSKLDSLLTALRLTGREPLSRFRERSR